MIRNYWSVLAICNLLLDFQTERTVTRARERCSVIIRRLPRIRLRVASQSMRLWTRMHKIVNPPMTACWRQTPAVYIWTPVLIVEVLALFPTLVTAPISWTKNELQIISAILLPHIGGHPHVISNETNRYRISGTWSSPISYLEDKMDHSTKDHIVKGNCSPALLFKACFRVMITSNYIDFGSPSHMSSKCSRVL